MITAYSKFLPPKNIPVNVYPNNEPIVKNEDVPNSFNTLVIRPRDMTEFLAALFIVDNHPELEHLIIPLIPGARQDRQMWGPTSDALQTLRSVSKLLKATGCKIHTLDPHSEKTEEYLEDSVMIYNIPEIILGQDFSNVTSVIAPDEGARERAGRIAALLGVPLVTFAKVRDTNTGNITHYDIDDSRALGFNMGEEIDGSEYRQSEWAKVGKLPFVVDDLCDGGATFMILAKSLKEHDASVSPQLYVTHGLFTKGYEQLTKYYTKIITTDSITGNDPHEQIKVIPFCDHLAWSICD